jgi:hypothetical protein
MCSLRQEEGASLDAPTTDTTTSDYQGAKARVKSMVTEVRGHGMTRNMQQQQIARLSVVPLMATN